MIRIKINGNWTYVQEVTIKEQPKKKFKLKKIETKVRSKSNQFGRFHYNELQYGDYDVKSDGLDIEIKQEKIRIRIDKGNWLYRDTAKTKIPCSRMRIRKNNSEWIYTAEVHKRI